MKNQIEIDTNTYLLKYKNMYELKFGKKPDFKIGLNEYVLSISKYFDFDIYLEIRYLINKVLCVDPKNCDFESLKKIHDNLYDIFCDVYLVRFNEIVSLEERMNFGNFWWDGGFSFNVSLFKPLKRSVLFN
ncbi:MAG: hypothetical protein WC011_03555 [Candidatus Paceibacterota bacterium]